MRDDGDRYPFDPARDVNALNEAMAHIPDVRMLMVDPLVSAVAGDSHKNAEVRRGLQPLVDLALKQRCALLGVTHFSKGTMGRDPVERITGSLAFGALARVVMVAARQEADKDRPVRRILMRAKSNIGPDGGGFAYDLHQGALADYPGVMASSVRWGDTIEGTAREVLADVERPEDHLNNDAGGFLRELLSNGGCSAKEIYRQAECVGFSRDAMKRAKRRIGAVAVKQGMEGGWGWRLPSKAGMASAEGSEGIAQIYPHSSLPSEKEALPSAWDSLPSTEARVETTVISIPSDTHEISSIGQDTSRTEASKDANPAFLQVGTLAETLTAQVFQEDEPCKDANLRKWHSYDRQDEPCKDANLERSSLEQESNYWEAEL